MPTKPKELTTKKTVVTLTHDEATRKNIPTAEHQSVMRKDEQSPIRIAYERRNRDLDPQLVSEAMRDGSDAIADWPLLNALLNTAAGASWVSIHNGGGVGIGYAQHAGMVVVADGTDPTAVRLERVLTTDPGMGIVRHADAGYERAIEVAHERGVKIPMQSPQPE